LAVKFGGRPDATVAVGAEISSDPVSLTVNAGQDLAVDLYLPAATGPATWHRSALQTSYVSAAGDHDRRRGGRVPDRHRALVSSWTPYR
jgi:hypothetical protein